MFTTQDRERIHNEVLEWSKSDARVVAAAVVGSLAHRAGDRWSDLDLTFAVEDHVPIRDVLDEWSERLGKDFDAVALFDLPSGATVYRVFLIPGCLQFDLSFSAAKDFGAIGPNFRLLYGETIEKPFIMPPSARDLFGYAIHHAVRARVCIDRARYWQAEYWISGVRDHVLSLACRRLGLPAYHGRGFDDLPSSVCRALADALVRSPERVELLRALQCAVDGLFRESSDVNELAQKIEPWIRQLVSV